MCNSLGLPASYLCTAVVLIYLFLLEGKRCGKVN